jgi:signal peptidase II
VKLKYVIVIIALIIIVDQVLKIWIKTTYHFGEANEITPWFHLHFIENPGMAWGWKFGNETGKIVLTLFRLAAVIFGTWYLGRIVKNHYHKGFIVCAALIYAGALGNLIDSMFYGMIFEDSTYNVSRIFPEKGYAGFLHGRVVDMLYFPMFNGNFPNWFPFVGGERFQFFSPIFNIADASISIGVITLLLFQKRLVHKNVNEEEASQTVTTNTGLGDKAHVM